jgi:CheY-like chemotaxis protein
MAGSLLIVDDEKEICEMLSRNFRMLGYSVKTASNGIEALDLLAKAPVDVVISDIMMPKMDGVSLLREVRSQYPMTHVVMITGYVTLENALACMRLQADTCVFKPLHDLTELESAVSDALKALDLWKHKFHELQGMKPQSTGNAQ